MLEKSFSMLRKTFISENLMAGQDGLDTPKLNYSGKMFSNYTYTFITLEIYNIQNVAVQNYIYDYPQSH